MPNRTLTRRMGIAIAILGMALVGILTLSACSSSQSPTGPNATPTPAVASNYTGDWDGVVKAAGSTLPFQVRFVSSATQLTGTIDIPLQGVRGQPLQNIAQSKTTISFEAFGPLRTARFDSTVISDNTIQGVFAQAGYTGTFSLSRTQPFVAGDYHQYPVGFSSIGATLSGTLTIPRGQGPFPAIVMVTGSGLQDRDEEIYGFRPFLLIADHLTSAGIAVLRYDDRGVGASVGDVSQATTETFAADAESALKFLASRADVDPRKLGMLGHSEGASAVAMVADRNPSVSFLILMGAPGLRGSDIVLDQIAVSMRQAGRSETEIQSALVLQRQVYAALDSDSGWDDVRQGLISETVSLIRELPEQDRKLLGDEKQYAEKVADQKIASAKSAWTRFFFTYDPMQTLSKVKVPVLALFGELDTQVSAINVAPVREALVKAGVTFDVVTIKSANHLFQNAATGNPDEYATLPKQFAPGFLEAIDRWLTNIGVGSK